MFPPKVELLESRVALRATFFFPSGKRNYHPQKQGKNPEGLNAVKPTLPTWILFAEAA
jgi:hypothetical protein